MVPKTERPGTYVQIEEREPGPHWNIFPALVIQKETKTFHVLSMELVEETAN